MYILHRTPVLARRKFIFSSTNVSSVITPNVASKKKKTPPFPYPLKTPPTKSPHLSPNLILHSKSYI